MYTRRILKTLMHMRNQGFTIVELLIVIVVIAILAAITIIGYNGISNRARDSAIQSDVEGFAKAIENDKTLNGSYPASAGAANNGKGLISGSGNTVAYNVDSAGSAFCLQVSRTGSQSYFATQSNLSPRTGVCAGIIGIASVGGSAVMQTVTNANCSTTRTRVVDARDGRTYWVQKLSDGKCWMLTNLAYAGGGGNTYGDIKTLTNGTGGSQTYTIASYYIPPNANPTSEPANPSTSTNGGTSNPQYGYFYNWCGAMGGQATAACANATTPAPIAATTVCPSGWRLPTGNGGELAALNTSVNAGSTTTDSGLLTNWLGHRAGGWFSGFFNQDFNGIYWSSTPSNTTEAYTLYADSTWINPAFSYSKSYAFAVRCVAI